MGNKLGKIKDKKKLTIINNTSPNPPPPSLLPEEALKKLEEALRNGIGSGYLGFTGM